MIIYYINMGFFERCLFVYLFLDYIKNNNREHYDKLTELFNYYFINVCHNMIYAYSYSQILYNKIHKKLVLFIEKHKILEHYNNTNNINNTNNNILETKYKIEYFNQGEFVTPNLQDSEYDLIIISDKNTSNKIITNNETIYSVSNNINFELSEIKFLLVEFIIGDKHFKLDFNTKTHNFYVIGNVINRNFILYFMKNIYHEHLSIQDLNNFGNFYMLKILDHNVNELILEMNNDNDSIIIQKNSYSVSVSVDDKIK